MLERQIKIGLDVRVCPNLTTDSYNMQGQIATIIAFNRDKDVIKVRFKKNRKIGYYEADALTGRYGKPKC